MKKSSFIIGLIGAILGIVSNGILLSSSDINNKLKMFTVAAIIFSIIALVGVLISSKIKSLARVLMFMGAISNIHISITSAINGNFLVCILCSGAAILLLGAGITQVKE